MPIAKYPDEDTNQGSSSNSKSNSDSKGESSDNSNSPNKGLSSSDRNRVGRATGTPKSSDRVSRATGGDSKESYKAPFSSDKFGVLGKRENQVQDRFSLSGQGSSQQDRYSLGVRVYGKDEGSLRSHVYRGFVDAGNGLISGAIAGGATGAITGAVGGAFVGGPPGSLLGTALGFATGSMSGMAKGMIMGPIEGCVSGCHGFDIENKSSSSIIDKLQTRIDKLQSRLSEDLGLKRKSP